MDRQDLVFRILTRADWRRCLEAGAVLPSPLDLRDGYLHLSSAQRLLETARLYFQLEDQPLVLELDATLLGESLRWESVASRDGALFPHLYEASIPLEAVRACWPLEAGEGGMVLGAREPHGARGG